MSILLSQLTDSIDQFVARFEAAWTAQARPDLKSFLPEETHSSYYAVLQELVCVDLELGWKYGAARALEDYEREFPGLFADAVRRYHIAFEDFRQRRLAGDNPDAGSYHERYGVDISSWLSDASAASNHSEPLPQTALLAANPAGEETFKLPNVGDDFLGFHLLSELGHGAFGRVYLAEQPGLANRKVVLKIAPDIGSEAQKLAQLQHTHIVPIYSVHQANPYQVVCMPYCGDTTLADVLRDLANRTTLPESAQDLLSTLREKSSSKLRPESVQPAPRSYRAAPQADSDETKSHPCEAVFKQLQGRSYVEAVLWMGKCLAEGLAHAHERGIVHRDLKPANVLITDEGQPMLLDFNLSEDLKLRSDSTSAMAGGTLPYMAPEALAAFQGNRHDIDGRCDIYALGILLFELLTNRSPFSKGRASKSQRRSMPELVEAMLVERRAGAPRLRTWNRAVSPATEAIVRHCLEPDPRRRYRTARELVEDLQCQLDRRPLKHAKEPSFRERAGKWLHRHPRFVWKLCGVAAALLLVLAVGFAFKAAEHARGEEALVCLEDFRGELSTVQMLLSAGADDPDRRQQGLQRGGAALTRYQVFSNPAWMHEPHVAALPEHEQRRLQAQIGELLLLMARAQTLCPTLASSSPAERREPLQNAIALNERAERCFTDGSSPPALWLQRADLLRQLGRADKAAEVARQADGATPKTANDHYLLAREHLAKGRLHKAVTLLTEATRLDPQHYWAWFTLANCHDEEGNDARAVTSYSVCIALAPKSYEACFNRGLAYLRQKENGRACEDFDKAIALRPEVPDGYMNRALARQGLKQYAAAINDLSIALTKDGAPTRIYFMRSRARERAGDKAGAKVDRQRGLQKLPADEKSWIARGMARLSADPKGALEDFEAALKLNPRSRAGLQNKAHVLAEKLGRTQESIAILNEAVSLYPEYVPARIGRGVLHARQGDRAAAVKDAEEALARDSRPLTRYQVACVYSLTAKEHKADAAVAMRHLKEAVARGFGADLLSQDTDLDPLRSLPEFQQLARAAAMWRAALQNSGRSE